MRVAFLLQDLQLSGGVGVIVEHAAQLRRHHDIDARLVLARAQQRPDWAYRGLSEVPVLTLEEARAVEWDVALATWWETTSALFDLPARRHAYFIQLLEDSTYPAGTPEQQAAAMTTALPVRFITEARWLAELAKIDRGNVDRVICFDANSWDAAAPLVPLWRAMPLPVDDRLYHAPAPSQRPPRIIFVGYSTMHREQSLIGLKHEFDLPHYAHALMGEELRAVLATADVALNVHGEEGLPTFENRVLLHLAAGSLVITEALEPPYGLEPNIDVLQVLDRDELGLRVRQLHAMPDLHDRIRIRGHHTSRRFAASQVWPRVIADLFADLRAFGTDRRPGAATVAA